MSEAAAQQASAELRRAEHLLYVSLKYTRTVDVIKHIIDRLIATYDSSMDALLIAAKARKQVTEVPTLPRVKVAQTQAVYGSDPIIAEGIILYLLLKKIAKARFERAMEYRRHVTMTAYPDEKKVEITIDIISEYYTKTQAFVKRVHDILHQ